MITQPFHHFLCGSYQRACAEGWAVEGRGQGGGLPWASQAAVIGVQSERVYLLIDTSYIFNVSFIKAREPLPHCFVPHWLLTGRGEDCYLLGPLKDPNRRWKPGQNLNNSLPLCSDHVPSNSHKEMRLRKCLLLPTGVPTSCLRCRRHHYRCSLCVFI